MKTVTGHDGAARRQHERSFKAELFRQSMEPGASVSAIALAGGVNANLLFKWRRDHLRANMASSAAPSSTVLLPVHVASCVPTAILAAVDVATSIGPASNACPPYRARRWH